MNDQRGFIRFMNQLSMVSFSSFVSQVVWFVGSLTFTYLVWWLATHDKAYIELAGALLFAWTGKSITNAVSNYGTRKTSREYVEAKAKGEAAATAEHSALPPLVEHAERVEQHVVAPEPLHRRSSELPTPSAASMELDTVEHEWARGDPREGIL